MIMKRNDGILLLFLLLLAVMFFAFQSKPSSVKADSIAVSTDGKHYGTWRLDSPQTISVVTSHGRNDIVIKDNAAFIISADCANRDCVRQQKISKIGDTIVCLPHQLVIEGKSENRVAEVDAVSR